ncbi:MAG: hypothetical protein ACK5NK_04090 [Niabella sp.]
MNPAVQLKNLSVTDYRTYLVALLFVTGNILLPQLVHFIPNGGFIFLPIYFFTLIAAYKYGLVAGLLTAVLSPLVNHWFFGMPPASVLPVILTKSVILAIAASLAAIYFKKVSVLALLLVVLAYQLIGTMIEWVMVKDFTIAFQDFRLGLPGMLIQVFMGYVVIKALAKL